MPDNTLSRTGGAIRIAELIDEDRAALPQLSLLLCGALDCSDDEAGGEVSPTSHVDTEKRATTPQVAAQIHLVQPSAGKTVNGKLAPPPRGNTHQPETR